MSLARYIGFGEETTFNTAVAASETVEPETEDIGPAGEQALFFPGASGVRRIVKPGPYAIEGGFTVLADLDATPLFWKLLLGAAGYSVTGTDPSYTHLFTLDRAVTLPSATLRVGRDHYEHIFSGCVVDQIALEVSRDDLARMTVDVMGAQDEKAAIQDPVTFTNGEVFAPHEITMSIGGNDESAEVESITITVQNGADIDNGRTIGSRFIRRAFPGEFMVTVEVDLAFLDTDNLERFWGQASGPIASGNLSEFEAVINLGANYDITVPRCVQPDIGLAIDGPERIQQSATFEAAVDSSTGEIIEVSVTNDVSTY